MFLLYVALLSACVDGTFALSLPQVNPTLLVAVNGSVLGAMRPNCDSSFYGGDLNVARCREAVRLMKYSYGATTYVQRNTQALLGTAHSLPDRWLSCKSRSHLGALSLFLGEKDMGTNTPKRTGPAPSMFGLIGAQRRNRSSSPQ